MEQPVFDPDQLTTETAKRLAEKMAREFGPEIMSALADPSVVEIMVNADGRLWVERLSSVPEAVGTVQVHQVASVIGSVASHYRAQVSSEEPILSCEVPFNGSRFQGWMPPIVLAPSIVIRKPASRVFTLADYVAQGVLTERNVDLLNELVDRRRNILVVGGTGSGKTTLANALLDAVSTRHPNQRIVTVEDTRELQCRSPNVLALRANDKVSMTDLIKGSLRSRPDRVIVGEVRDAAALDILDVWNTGHEGGVATVHANSAREGLNRIEALVRRHPAGARVSGREIASVIHASIFIAKTGEGRRVQAIEQVVGHDGTDYQFQSYEQEKQ